MKTLEEFKALNPKEKQAYMESVGYDYDAWEPNLNDPEWEVKAENGYLNHIILNLSDEECRLHCRHD